MLMLGGKFRRSHTLTFPIGRLAVYVLVIIILLNYRISWFYH